MTRQTAKATVTAMPPDPAAGAERDWVRLKSADFVGALTTVLRVHKRGQLLRLSFTDGALRLLCASSSISVPAEGVWRGEASAPALAFKVVLRMPESFPEVMEIRRDGAQLDLDHYSLPCAWSARPTTRR